MNLFVLNKSPTKSAILMCDKHVVKMILEVAQMLSTAHRELNSKIVTDDCLLYKKTHLNHPSTIWVRTSGANYVWSYMHFVALCDEYTKRYGKVHLSETKLKETLAYIPCSLQTSINIKNLTIPPLCMPEEYYIKGRQQPKSWNECVLSYQAYYKGAKAYMATYKFTSTPNFLK